MITLTNVLNRVEEILDKEGASLRSRQILALTAALVEAINKELSGNQQKALVLPSGRLMRRGHREIVAMKEVIVAALKEKGSLSSFEAQDILDIRKSKWGSSALRRCFRELIDGGFVNKTGAKRATRYWIVP